MAKTPIVISLLFFISLCGHSQELSHKQYTVKDGLPGSVVYNTLQDRKGFIWFATNQGVSRFDGQTFKNYFKEDGLPDNEILKLYLDQHDNIWFISFLGIPAVLHNEKIYSFPSCTNVFQVIEDFASDSILLYSYTSTPSMPIGGYYRSANSPGHWSFENHLRKQLVARDYPDALKGSSAKKVNFYFSLPEIDAYEFRMTNNGRDYRFRLPRVLEDMYPLMFNRQSQFAMTPDKLSIIFSADSFYIANKSGVKGFIARKELQLTLSDLAYLYPENDSVLWVCTRKKGLIKIENYSKPNKKIRYYFPKAFCTSIIKDREGGYWITTHNDGVYYVPNRDFYYTPSLTGENAKDIKVICAFNSQTLLAGSTDGSISMVDHGSFINTPLDKWSINNKNNRVLDIRVYDHEHFFIASDYGLFLYSFRDKAVRLGTMLGVKSLVLTTDTSLLITSAAGIYSWNIVARRFRLVFPKRGTWIDGGNGKFYWGTLSGLYSFTNNNIYDWGLLHPTLRGIINHINFAPDSSLWVSTQQGLVILKNSNTITIAKKDGLLSDNCKHVLFKNNIAWISTDKGITRLTYNWKAGQLVYTMSTLTENDGLLSDDVNQCLIAGNYVWAATARGLCTFPEDHTGYFSEPPLLNITGITAGDEKLPYDKKVQIDYRKNKLVIGLSGISYRSGKNIGYEYRIRDIDSGWNVASTNQLEFSILPFGGHLFEARAVDRWGIRSEIRSFSFTVIPPFWKTSWFTVLTYFITAFLIGLVAYIIYRNRQRKKDKEHRLEKKMYQLEIMALKAQMNPHFIFNCLSSIQHYIIRADITNANLYLHKFSRLIRNTLELSSRVDITLEEELKQLNLYLELEKLRMGDRMDYKITVAGGILPAAIRIPSMIIQTYVENAIRHGISPLQDRTGMVLITFVIESGYLVCTIDDNGIGIDASMAAKKVNELSHHSMGTGITGSRIIIINAIQEDKMRLNVTDKNYLDEGPGTRVRISFRI